MMKIKYDWSGKIYNKLHGTKITAIGFSGSIFMYWWCKLFNIKIGKNNVFYGRAKIRRQFNGRIEIGNSCRFTSIRDRNMIALHRPCYFTAFSGGTIIIGNNCGFSGTILAASSTIEIGNDVKFGANCLLMDYEGHSEDPRSGSPKKIIIQDNVWLGTNVTVMKGVTIGKNCLIGANSLVTRDIPANSIAAGSPCRVLRAIPQPPV